MTAKRKSTVETSIESHEALPTLVYDGECALCRKIVSVLERMSSRRMNVYPYQLEEKERRFPSLSIQRMQNSAIWIDEQGRIFDGGMTPVKVISYLWPKLERLSFLARLPGAKFLLEQAYRILSNNRAVVSKVLGFSKKTATEYLPDKKG